MSLPRWASAQAPHTSQPDVLPGDCFVWGNRIRNSSSLNHLVRSAVWEEKRTCCLSTNDLWNKCKRTPDLTGSLNRKPTVWSQETERETGDDFWFPLGNSEFWRKTMTRGNLNGFKEFHCVTSLPVCEFKAGLDYLFLDT